MNYLYLLTPEGLAKKTKLTLNFYEKKWRSMTRFKKRNRREILDATKTINILYKKVHFGCWSMSKTRYINSNLSNKKKVPIILIASRRQLNIKGWVEDM